MSKEIIKIDEITKTVSDLTKFDITCEALKKEVKKTKDITVDNLEDSVQLERVKRGRIDLRNIEIEIEKQGKSYRDIFTKVNKDIMAKQNELLAITNPELDRLKNIEEQAKAIATRKEREMILPYRREKLAEVDNITDDEDLLEMDDKQFGEYLMLKTEEKDEKERLEKEEADREEQKQIEIAEAKANAKKEAEEKAEIEKAEAKKLADAEIERLKQEAKDKIEAEKRLAKEKELKAKEEADKREADIKREADEKIEAEKRLAKEKDYKKFLSDNGYNEKEFKIIKEDNEVKLYKFVATYKIK